MFVEAWFETCAGVAVELEVFDEYNIGKSSFLWEAIHDFANFDKDFVVNKEVFNLIFINEIFGGGSIVVATCIHTHPCWC